MMKNILHKCLVILLCQTLIYTPLLRADQLASPINDLAAPNISQNEYVNTASHGADHKITVTVTDNHRVKLVTLHYRKIGTEEYKQLVMDKVIDTDDYSATINADQFKAPGIEYYVGAEDIEGNSVLHGYPFSPLSVSLSNEAPASVATSDISNITAEDESSNIWLWVGLGALALLAASVAIPNDPAPPADTGTIVITGNAPE